MTEFPRGWLPGVELGGALKNVLALACGISDGLGFGCNGRAALITRGLSEMTRLAVALGAHPLTMGGLAGMGDLVLTCTGATTFAVILSTSIQFPLTSLSHGASDLQAPL